MADFKIAHKLTSYNEGGFQCMPDDNGNWTGGEKGVGNLIGTKYGISAPVLCSYLKREATPTDMRNLSRENAESIYKWSYWNAIRGDEINNQEQANQIYDMAVNAGVGTAINLCQRALGIAETGVMTTTTINKLNNKA
jgi:lysozyme family protein